MLGKVLSPSISIRKLVLILISALAFSVQARAQVFDFEKDRMEIAELDGLWRFHTGDDPRWSDLDFDDSAWTLLKSDRPWTVQGYVGYGGMAWYRFKVLIPEHHKQLEFRVPQITTTYEIFVNGKLIAAVGEMPPKAKTIDPVLHVHAIPDAAIGTAGRCRSRSEYGTHQTGRASTAVAQARIHRSAKRNPSKISSRSSSSGPIGNSARPTSF